MKKAVGILMTGTNIHKAKYIKEILKCCYLYGVEAYIYNIREVKRYISDGYVKAYRWDTNDLVECEIDLPACTEFCVGNISNIFPEEFMYLKKHTLMADNFAPSKSQLHCQIMMSELMPYAIPTYHIRSFADLKKHIPFIPNAILKPTEGRYGIGLIKATYKDGCIYFSSDESTSITTEEQFKAAVYTKDDKPVDYLLEPCINIRNKDGKAVDFRVLVALDGTGQWTNILTYARIGSSSVVSNISDGGSVSLATSVLEAMFPDNHKEKLDEINELGIKIAAFVADMREGASRFGIDICLDVNTGHPYIIEVNSMPGDNIIGPWPMSLKRAEYLKYLLSTMD